MGNLPFKNILFQLVAFLFCLYLIFQAVIGFEQYKGKSLFEKVKNHKRVFVYQTYLGPLDQAYYVEDAKDTILLIDYYRKLAKKDTTAELTFDYNHAMPIDLIIPTTYVNEYKKGSQVIELVNFNTKCWGYLKGYVYLPTTHLNPPIDSLAKKYFEMLSRLPTGKDQTPFHHGGGVQSQYGWFCDR